MKRITIYDVAKEAGVSLATVSRVINGSNVVKQPTREKVQAAVDKLGYKPNALAQSLALQKTTTIALVIPEASFTYTGQIINGLLDVAKIYDYNIMLHTITSGITDIKEIIENIIKSHVDGVIVYNDRLDETETEAFAKYNIPVVSVGTLLKADNACSVYVDIAGAVYELTKKYLATGKDNIAILEDRKNPTASESIVQGATKAFKECGHEFGNFLKIPENDRTSYAFLSKWLKKHRYDLMIGNRDSQAMAIVNAARENGIAVPDDMEVVCVIDTKYNAMMRPQISSFAVPSYDLGAVAMRVMTKMLNKDEEIEQTIELSYLYTPRGTTKD